MTPARSTWLLGVALLIGCDPGCAPSTRPKEQTLVFGTLAEPDTLDPVFSETAGASEIVKLLFRGLTAYDDRWIIQPSLAAEVPTATTSTTGVMIVKWRLKSGLKWSDGKLIEARDVEFGHRIEIDPRLEVTARVHAERVARMQVDANDLTVYWKTEVRDFASPDVHPVLPSHAYPDPEKSPRPFVGMGRKPISSGPYILERWIPGASITLLRNPQWMGPPPPIERLVWRFFKTEDSFEPELISGGIDALGEGSGLSVERARALGERLSKTHVVHFTDSGTWLHVDARLDDVITGELAVRRAIHLAIDRKALADLVYEGAAIPAGGCFPPRHPAYSGIKAPDMDLVAAERSLEEAGWKRGAGGVRVKDGKPLRLRMALASGSDASLRAASYLESQLGKIGLAIDLETLPLSALFERMRAKQHPPLSLYAWRLRPDWDLVSVLKTNEGQNYTLLSDPEIDRLLDRAMSDPSAWAESLAAVERRYVEILPSIPLLFRNAASLRPKNLEGWRPTGTTTPVTWNAEVWRVAGMSE